MYSLLLSLNLDLCNKGILTVSHSMRSHSIIVAMVQVQDMLVLETNNVKLSKSLH